MIVTEYIISNRDYEKDRKKEPKRLKTIQRDNEVSKTNKLAHNRYVRWTDEEIRKVVTSELSDIAMAVELGRTVSAITAIRYQARWCKKHSQRPKRKAVAK